jgi:TusA-related sulfurtransferase
MDRIDVRGLSCPQPVLETKKKIDASGSGSFEVIADSGTARDNIIRMAGNNGWDVSVIENGDEFVLTLKK